MPRLLLTTIDFPPQTGGVARYLDALAYAFRDDVVVVAQEGNRAHTAAVDASAGYPIERVRLYGSFFPRWLPMIRVFIDKRESYDVAIVSHVLPVGTAAWIASWVTGKPYIVIVHGLDMVLAGRSHWKRWLASSVLRGAEVVVTNSKALATEVGMTYGVERTLTVYPGVKPAFMNIARDNATHQGVRLLTVARLVSRKGHLRVLEALALLIRQNKLEGVQYMIVGDGPMLETIQQEIRHRGLEHMVDVVMDANDEAVRCAYAQADVFVMPTVDDPLDREGFGTVYLEAAACGLPSIATRLPGVDEAVLDEETGLLVPDGDIEALAAAIERLVNDPQERKRLGSNGRARVNEAFSAERQFEPLYNLLYSREVNE